MGGIRVTHGWLKGGLWVAYRWPMGGRQLLINNIIIEICISIYILYFFHFLFNICICFNDCVRVNVYSFRGRYFYAL